MRQLRSVAWAVFVSAAAFVLACTGPTRLQAAAVDEPCVFTQTFDRPNEPGKAKVHVYQGQPGPVAGDVAPLIFVSDLKVNTDGTRISYKVDDPTAQHGAINDMRNAMRSGAKLADFTAIAATGWMPLSRTWEILSDQVIEKDKTTGKPCVTADNYLVSKTSDVAVAGGFGRDGDCDQSKWIDALTIPAIVLPEGNTQFKAHGALTRTPVVVMTVGSSRRIAFGIVGDYGPPDKLGEASVEMNRILNGLPAGSVPSSGHDAIAHYQAPRSVVLLFPGATNRVPYPITPDRVQEAVQQRFSEWGGKARLVACLATLPDAK